ncbi:hypothetical protein F5146DRAFT_209867 [Armillaria mellea]|nr:hypothetical protein F5146DRAFT_209867 [Armillaria mellea]
MICLASPIIPPAARTLGFQPFDPSAVESPLRGSILRLTTNVQDISFFKVSWDKLPEEVLNVNSSYQNIPRILFKDTAIPNIGSFSFFRSCTIRSSFTLILSGSLHVGNAEEQVELTPLQTYDSKPIVIPSLTIECPDAPRKALRAILVLPSSPFNLRNLVTVSLAIIDIPPEDTWIYANVAFQRDAISSSNLLENASSHFVLQAAPSSLSIFLPPSRH